MFQLKSCCYLPKVFNSNVFGKNGLSFTLKIRKQNFGKKSEPLTFMYRQLNSIITAIILSICVYTAHKMLYTEKMESRCITSNTLRHVEQQTFTGVE